MIRSKFSRLRVLPEKKNADFATSVYSCMMKIERITVIVNIFFTLGTESAKITLREVVNTILRSPLFMLSMSLNFTGPRPYFCTYVCTYVTPAIVLRFSHYCHITHHTSHSSFKLSSVELETLPWLIDPVGHLLSNLETIVEILHF